MNGDFSSLPAVLKMDRTNLDAEAQCATRDRRTTGLDVLLQSSWYILVSTGAIMGLIVVLACSIVLLGLHLSITQARGIFAELSAHLR